MIRVGGLCGALLFVALLTGCAAGGLDVQMASRDIAADPDATFAAAQAALAREFDRLNVDRAARRITSEPQEYTTQSESLTSRDLVGARSTMRRIAMLNVVSRGEGKSQVRLRIDRQREDTTRTERASAEQQYRLSDSPSYTPIERDAGTSTQQNTVWTTIGRDSKLERELLGELERQFSRASPEIEAAGSAPGAVRPEIDASAAPQGDTPRAASSRAAENR